MSRFDLIIFDCDGVLVDSERLAVREAEIISNLGWPLTEAEIVERFVGRSVGYMQSEVERHIGRAIDWEIEVEPQYYDLLRRELVPVEGIIEALDKISIPMCIASSGSQEKMNFTLDLTGLGDRFADHVFSVDQVEHGKPAPDVFLYAADQMDVLANRCAVVEDSVAGVMAGLSAQIAVFAFAGGVTRASQLSQEGVVVFENMRDLPELLSAQ